MTRRVRRRMRRIKFRARMRIRVRMKRMKLLQDDLRLTPRHLNSI